jgi:hypothetical protein
MQLTINIYTIDSSIIKDNHTVIGSIHRVLKNLNSCYKFLGLYG